MKMSMSEIFAFFGAVFVVAAGYGWVANIVKLIGLLDGGVTAWMIFRTVGVFAAPLGAILGYF